MAYFAELKNAPYKRWVELGEGTHFMMLEKNRMQFIHEVELFLEESHKPWTELATAARSTDHNSRAAEERHSGERGETSVARLSQPGWLALQGRAAKVVNKPVHHQAASTNMAGSGRSPPGPRPHPAAVRTRLSPETYDSCSSRTQSQLRLQMYPS